MKAIWACLLLAGCATSSQLNLPDGRVGHSINCPGAANNWGNCYAKAGEICGTKGYDVWTQDGSQTPVMAGSYGPNGGVVTGGAFVGRNLLIACKG